MTNHTYLLVVLVVTNVIAIFLWLRAELQIERIRSEILYRPGTDDHATCRAIIRAINRHLHP